MYDIVINNTFIYCKYSLKRNKKDDARACNCNNEIIE